MSRESGLNYFVKDRSNSLACSGTNCSSNVPNYFFTKEEKEIMGIGLTLSEWINVWKTKDCPSIFSNMIYINGKYSEYGFKKAVECYNYIFYSYFGPYDADTNPKGGHVISDMDEMSNFLINSCIKNQGVCQCVAHTICSDCSSLAIHESKLLRKLGGCACKPQFSGSLGLDRNCDPTCASRSVSKTRDYKSGKVGTCSKRVCFIDPVTNLPFSEECPHCYDGECTCVIDSKGHHLKNDNCKVVINVSRNNCEQNLYSYYWVLVVLFLLLLAMIVVIIIRNPTNDKEMGENVDDFQKSLASSEPIFSTSFSLNPKYYSFNLTPDFMKYSLY